MQKYILLAILASFSTTSFASNLNLENTIVTSLPSQALKPFSFSARLISAQYTYREPGIMKIDGALNGVGIEGSANLKNNLILKGEIDFLSGEPTYDGSLMNGTPISHKTKDHYHEVRGLIGNNKIANGPFSTLEISTGLGYRYLNDDGKSQHAYEREQTYTYLPLIVGLNLELKSKWFLRTFGEIDILLSGQNKSHLNNVHESLPKLKFNQDSGTGLRLGATLSRDYNTVSTFVRLDYTTWDVGASNAKPLTDGSETIWMHEPDNKTQMTSLALGITY